MLVHQVVTSYLAATRSSISAHKNRTAVSGSGAKPWAMAAERHRASTSRDYRHYFDIFHQSLIVKYLCPSNVILALEVG